MHSGCGSTGVRVPACAGVSAMEHHTPDEGSQGLNGKAPVGKQTNKQEGDRVGGEGQRRKQNQFDQNGLFT